MRRIDGMGSRLRRAILAAGTLAGVAVACGGCAFVVPTTSLDREPESRWQAKDVPVPEGFKFKEKQSLTSDKHGLRTLKLVYRRDGYIDVERTCDFYQEHLTGRGWSLQFLYGFDRRGMILWKGDEEIRVTVDRSLPEAYVIATVEVEPRDLGGAIPIVARRSD